tara:strand:- start:3380 stop:4390 length:1011 start_codon:yes stop_codon:yes gene_type:complete
VVTNLLETEEAVIKKARQLLEDKDILHLSAHPPYLELLNAYEKLNKDLKRLIRLSDRNQDRLNQANSKLEEFSSKLSKYFSPQVYQSIFSGELDVSVQSARKPLTIFFSDLQDFTELTERLEPEVLTDLLTNYLTEMSRIAIKWGGTIDKFIGDAILIFFGDPIHQGNSQDAISCVSMALEMLEKLEELRTIWRKRGLSRELNLRIGIHSGICTVGNFGSEDRLDYTVIGNSVNLASRLESNAKKNTILISEDTYLLVKDKVKCESLEEISVKGISYPIQTYSVKGFFKEKEESKEFLAEKIPGLNLSLYPSEIHNREAALKLLNNAINLIGNKKD